MKSRTIINEIKRLSNRRRQVTAKQLGDLAKKLAAATDPDEISRLKEDMTQGFYGS